MKNIIITSVLLVSLNIFSISSLHAQEEVKMHSFFNTKQNYVLLNASTGGGDYPFFGLGVTLSRKFFKGGTMFGVGVHYIGNTITDNFQDLDELQYFPIMLEIRQKFSQSRQDRFASYLIFDGGYVVDISGNDSNILGEYEYKNGWAINPGISFRFNVFENVGIMADVTWFHHCSPREWLPPIHRRNVKCWDEALLRGSVFF